MQLISPRGTGQPVFVTLAEQGIVGAAPAGRPEHVPAHPVRGEIDIVGAGDAVTANLAAALAAGASHHEAMELAMAAASIVIHQLGTTGTASICTTRRLCASDQLTHRKGYSPHAQLFLTRSSCIALRNMRQLATSAAARGATGREVPHRGQAR